MKKALSFLVILNFSIVSVFGGVDIVRSNGITLTGADGINYVGTSGIVLTGADGLLAFRSNGITLTGADGIVLTGADGITEAGANGASYPGANGITLTGADGITLTGADSITLTGTNGVLMVTSGGNQYQVNSILVRRPSGITLTGTNGIVLTGADGVNVMGPTGAQQAGPNGITLTGADGITLTGADGITLTGADGITLTGADSITGFNTSGAAFDLISPTGITLTGADGITLTGADGITLSGADNVVFSNFSDLPFVSQETQSGLQGLDPELALRLNSAADDSSINAVIVYHGPTTDADLGVLQQLGIVGGTRFRQLPMIYVSGTKSQIVAISHLARVRSIYGNRTLSFDSDPFFKTTGIQRVGTDGDLRTKNNGLPVTGRNVTVAVLDTGINGQHADLTGRVIQNVRLADSQSAPLGFQYPQPLENILNSDPIAGHGTFVAGVIAGSGASSSGKFAGTAPGAKLLGLSAGDVDLMHILSGFDYLLDKGANYNTRVVNCSFSANTVFDYNDPINVATKMLTDRNMNIVFSAGNSGSGNGTMNPYAMAPWVIGVGASDEKGVLAPFSSRGTFGGENQQPTLVAPGVNIASLRNPGTTTSISGLGGADAQRLAPAELPYYTTASGTSFSAPQVSGAIALMLEANPALTPRQVKDILSRSATPLPKYFFHEVGAGMLNTHAAVLEAAFPDRRMGMFRSTVSRNRIRFITSTSQSFTDLITPGVSGSDTVSIPSRVVQSSIGISWAFGNNDFGLKVFDSANTMIAESNYLNSPGLTGRREEVVLRNPAAQTLRAVSTHSFGIGTAQNVYGAVETTRVEFPQYSDLASCGTFLIEQAERSMIANIVLAEGTKYRPDGTISRGELASVLMRAGAAPQFSLGSPLFTDVVDPAGRNVVESVQASPYGRLIYDVSSGGRFYPDANASKLVLAVALVKAANLESLAISSTLSPTITDAASIPVQLKGYVSVALQKGFITLDGNQFNSNRSITRIELARSMNAFLQ